MPRGRLNLHGRTKAVPVVTFRVSADERAAGEAKAARDGIGVNEVARRAYLAAVGVREGSMSTQVRGDLTVEYDP